MRGLVRQVMNSDGDVTVIMSPVKLRARKWRVVTAEAASAANNPYVAFVDDCGKSMVSTLSLWMRRFIAKSLGPRSRNSYPW